MATLNGSGVSSRPWRAFPARSAVPGFFAEYAYRSRPFLKTLKPEPASTT